MGLPITKCADRFIETTIDDEVVIMDLESGAFFSLSGSALSIWNAIDGTRDRVALLAALGEEYGTDGAAFAGDVDDFVAQLAETGLVSEA